VPFAALASGKPTSTAGPAICAAGARALRHTPTEKPVAAAGLRADNRTATVPGHDEIGASAPRLVDGREDAHGIAWHIADHAIELGHGDAHARMLARSLALAGQHLRRDNGTKFPLAMARTSLRIVDSLSAIPRRLGCARRRSATFVARVLHALHETGCAAPETGWTPR